MNLYIFSFSRVNINFNLPSTYTAVIEKLFKMWKGPIHSVPCFPTINLYSRTRWARYRSPLRPLKVFNLFVSRRTLINVDSVVWKYKTVMIQPPQPLFLDCAYIHSLVYGDGYMKNANR